jgi:cytohesin
VIPPAARPDELAGRLFDAVAAGDVRAVRRALTDGAQPNTRRDGATALHVAVHDGHLEIAALLLAQGADVELRDGYFDHTPLELSLGGVRLEMVELLLARGADVNARGHKRRTPLFTAAFNADPAFVKLLVRQGAQVNAQDDKGYTALYYAAVKHGLHEGVAAALLAAGADLRPAGNPPREPLLHVVAGSPRPGVVAALLVHGADPNVRDRHGLTALHVAVAADHPDAVRALLRHGADVNARTATAVGLWGGIPAGSTPLALARSRPHLAEVLRAAGGRE